jgi:hypothetical protein
MLGGVGRTATQGLVADPLLEVQVFDRVKAHICSRNNVHPHIVANLDKVAEPIHWLHRLLGRGQGHHAQQQRSYEY